MEFLVILLYALIIITTVLAQFLRIFQESNKFDFLLFINVFKLFSPKPVNIDIRIFYRDLYNDNFITDLIEFKYYSRPTIYKSLWFFGQKEFYSISRCLKAISWMNRKSIEEEKIFNSRFYKRIQTEVMKINKNDKLISRQIVFISHISYTDNNNSNIYLIKNIKLKKQNHV